MICFLPFADFNLSARVLDNSRLGNQGYREGKALLNGAWSGHVASQMWFNFEGKSYAGALALYVKAMLQEFERRGGHTSVNVIIPDGCDLTMPPWLGDERLHSSHRGALLWKKPEWYQKFGWQDSPVLDYYWPTSKRPWPQDRRIVNVG